MKEFILNLSNPLEIASTTILILGIAFVALIILFGVIVFVLMRILKQSQERIDRISTMVKELSMTVRKETDTILLVKANYYDQMQQAHEKNTQLAKNNGDLIHQVAVLLEKVAVPRTIVNNH